MSSPPTPPTPPSARPPRGPVRVGRIVAGVLLAVAGVVLVAGGLVAQGASAVWDAKHPDAAGDAPGEVSLTTEDRSYTVALGSNSLVGDGTIEDRNERRITEGEVAAARCTVTHPDGSTQVLRGDRQSVSFEVNGSYATVGTFDGQAGDTTVACVFDPSEDLDGRTSASFVVHDKNAVVTRIAWVAVGLGVLLGLLGALQVLRGTVWRPRQPPSTGQYSPLTTK